MRSPTFSSSVTTGTMLHEGWPDGRMAQKWHGMPTIYWALWGVWDAFFGGVILARFLACSSTILEGWARAIQKIGQIDHHCWISTWLWMGKIGHCMALLHPCVYHHYPHEHSHFKGISVSPIFRQSHIHRRILDIIWYHNTDAKAWQSDGPQCSS